MSKEADITVDSYSESKTEAKTITEVGTGSKSKWRYVWDTLDKPAEERRFLFKLDLGLLTAACLGFFIKYLDQSNLNNAFVSGMKEDLNMYRNQLNYVGTLWTIGYILGEIPSNILITRIRPSIWIPGCQIVWTILTMAMSRCNNVTQLYVLRFFIGLAESGYYPGMSYLLGSWYRKEELAKRIGLFNASSAVATMFSGYLMTAVIGLKGRNGFKGWQWLFLMDGVISFPIAILSFFLIPDHPTTTRAFYLNESDKVLAQKRMGAEGRAPRGKYTKAKVVKVLKSWPIYLLPLLYLFNAGASVAPVFSMYLKDAGKYSVAQINNYPTITSAVQIVATLAYTWISDTVLKGRRYPLVIFSATLSLIFYISLAIWNVSEGWKWACFILMGQSIALSSITMAWANEICSNDAEERAVVVAWTNDFAYVINAWLPLIIWQQVDAPEYRKGYITSACTAVFVIILGIVIPQLIKRDGRRKLVSKA